MRLSFINHFKEDMNSLKIVTNSETIDKFGKFTEDGVHSKSIFGTTSGAHYSCGCGDTNGRFSKGVQCPECGTMVIENTQYDKTGWIFLDTDSILINPILYHFLKKVMPLEKILNPEFISTKKYEGIGVMEFYNNYDEIYKFFSSRKKKISTHMTFLEKNRESIFTDKVFVSSITTRAAKLVNGRLVYDKLNDLYSGLLKHATLLKQMGLTEPIKMMLRHEMQEMYNSGAEYIFDILKGKSGLLKGSLLGYRVNFSARSIIVPGDMNHKIDEIHISYVAFLELFKYHIIHIMKVHWGYDVLEANNRIFRAKRVFDDKLYDFATKKLLEEHDTRVIFNRNPTISVGSIIQLRLTKVHRDMSNFTFTISNNILPLLAGDYDGDTLNLFLLIDDKFRDFLTPLNPVNLIIDNNTGKLNRSLSVDRDVVVGLNNFIHKH